MSLPKKDIKVHVSDLVHKTLMAIKDSQDKFGTLDAMCAHVLTSWALREAQASIKRADEFRRLGIDEGVRESQFGNGLGE